jgi:hypothetical protein
VLPGLLVLLILGSARADIRPVVQGSLLDVGLTWPGLLDMGFLQVGGGARFGEHMGVLGGTSLLWGKGYEAWLLPPTVTLFWDFNPDELARRSLGYLRVAWCPINGSIDDMGNWTGFMVSAGVSYTWYWVTPHVELDGWLSGRHGSGVGATLGIKLGGTYVIQPRRPPEDE